MNYEFSAQILPQPSFSQFELKQFLDTIGPTAALIFASWIFMGFLQQRYVSAFDRYRSLIADYRKGGQSKDRMGNIKDQVMVYKRRCQIMKKATNLGMVAAIFLTVCLIAAALHVVAPSWNVLKYISASLGIFGLITIIISAVLVIVENCLVQRALDSEVLDIPELAEKSGQKPGDISDPHR